MKRRVVITGCGVVSPVGIGINDFWNSLRNGKSGIDYISLFDAALFPIKIAGEVKNFDINNYINDKYSDINFNSLKRHSLFALAAADLSIIDSGINKSTLNSDRCGVFLGSDKAPFDFSNTKEYFTKMYDSTNKTNRYLLDTFDNSFEYWPHTPAYYISKYYNIHGHVGSCSTSCSSSTNAISFGANMIAQDKMDIMIVGGTSAMIDPIIILAFSLLQTLSTNNDSPQRACRPFDYKRDGFILSEGAGILILESLDSAIERDANIYSEIIGFGSTSDAFRVTDPHMEGRGASQAMKIAIENSNIQPEEINYINAHGTSTYLNDKIETLAIKKVFNKSAYSIPISSTKSTTGHLMTSAGAIELIACCLAIKNNEIPPTINYENFDSECDLNYVPNSSIKAKVDIALSNSFGFGGQNASIIIKRFN